MGRMAWNRQNGLQALVIIEFLIIFSFVGHQYMRYKGLNKSVIISRGHSTPISARGMSKYFVNGTLPVERTRSIAPFSKVSNSSSDALKETSTPRIVYQFLDGKTFTFRNYLSILSVYKILRPYRIILYVPDVFNPKPLGYNMWFQKAADMIPYLEVIKYYDEIGTFTGINELQHVSTVLSQTGGVYVNLNTIINGDLWKQANDNIRVGIAGNSSIGFIAVSKHFGLTDVVQKITLFEDLTKQNYTTDCAFPHLFKGHEQCCIIPNKIFPVNIMRHKSPFASFMRSLFYGTSQIREPQRSFPPIPKIVHYTWFGGGEMTYSMYLSFQSTLRFVKPLQVIIYVDSYDLGVYFEVMKNSSLVTVVYYGRPRTVFQRPISNPSHISDYVRTDVLLRLGGIYLDWDAFWLKPVDDLLALGYETIAALDHWIQMGRQEFPDTINMGVVLARPGSRFIALWQESFHKYIGKHATFHAVEMVYKLYEEHPDLLYIEKRLQVMCFMLKCHPLWLSNYQEDRIHNEFNFTRDAYAVHFTHPIPKAFESEEEMRKSEGFFTDMARHVYGT